ncbi:MAG: aldolase/citrate lyase family protein [Kiritimatiellales bacterium]
MQGAQIREKLLKGQRVYGTHIVSFGNPITTRLAAELELDFIFICTEHMPIDRSEVSLMCQYWATRGISPIVRIPYPSARLAGQFIDGGAQGIVAPYVETVEEVKELAGAVRYRPIKGEFLNGILNGDRKPNDKLSKFFKGFNRDLYLIIGIESVSAINRLEELISIDGVDGVFLGPHDITCSMEIPEEYENPEFVKTVVDVIKRCRKAGKGVGIHMDLALPRAKPFLDAGTNFMLHVADIIKMRQIMSSDLKMLRSGFGDIYTRDAAAVQDAASCIKQK